jgi:heptosyltransferase-3
MIMSAAPKKILIIAVPGFGDVLLCTPLISAVRSAWPGAELHVLVRGKVSGVLEGNPDVDEVIEAVNRAGVRETLALLRSRFREYDLVLSNSASDRMALYCLCMGRRRISIVPQHGSGIPWKEWLYDGHVEADEENYHVVTRINELGKLAGIEPGQRVVNPRSPGSHEVIAKHLGHDWDKHPFAVVHPAASLPEKQWHADGWHAVANHLNAIGLRVIVTGGPGEAERRYVCDELGFEEASVTTLVGQLRLGDITRLLESCTLYIGVDTLVSHIASSAGAPTVAIFGPMNPLKWGPWPYEYEAPVSPYDGKESQRVGNVCLVRNARGDLASLGEAEVLNAIDAMLEIPVRHEQG